LEAAKKALLALVHDLDAEALQAILKIDEPDTFRIGEDNLDAEVLLKLKPTVQLSSDILLSSSPIWKEFMARRTRFHTCMNWGIIS
jgi:hypothetical protein